MNSQSTAIDKIGGSQTHPMWDRPVLTMLLPAGAIFLSYALDWLMPKVLMAPLLCLIFLGLMALNSRPRVVRAWAFVYVLVVLWGLLTHYGPDFTMEEKATVAVRLSGFAITCGLLVLLSRNRLFLIQQKKDIFNLLMAMPLPVILSDAAGMIVMMNDSAKELIRAKDGDLNSLSYFYLFSNPHEQGKTIAAYLDFLDKPSGQTIETAILIRHMGIQAKARQVAVTLESRKFLMSVFTTFSLSKDVAGKS
ncbi:MAG: PAS domain-containing protein [Candidatus Methylacidiphilales bacterium]|nr:PAS domain-containing protein [Candidatus Methylacidiphilales bacterium]